MATKAQKTAEAELYAELKTLQSEFQKDWVNGSLPDGWNDIPALYPARPEKVKITIALDEDMVKWFRKLGRGYQARINAVLRVYWQALLSGQIKSHWDAEAVGPQEHSLLEDALKRKLSDLHKAVAADTGDLAELEQDLSEGLAMVQRLHRNG